MCERVDWQKRSSGSAVVDLMKSFEVGPLEELLDFELVERLADECVHAGLFDARLETLIVVR